jgi:putative DNA primase/helicase
MQEATWPNPEPLPSDIPEVPEFDPDLLPDSLRPWITDIAERMQCPLDYPAAACMVVLSAVVGRQVTIRPQEQDDWTVVPNLWGAIIGPPGAMKSPPMKEVLKPIEVLEEAARERHELNLTEYEAKLKVAKQAAKVADQSIKKALGEGDEQRAEKIAIQSKRQEPKLPTRQRYLTQDTTIEKLGELLAGNPNGILVYRDELVGWLRSLEKQGHESDRAFYLEAWDGNGRFTFDRIGRGTIEIDAATVSILGGIQPGPLTAYLTSALRGGAGDDGLLQRFQLAVWPSMPKTWTPVDRKPHTEARQQAFEVFLQLSVLQQVEAERDLSSPLPYVRFAPDAQVLFKERRERLELRLRAGGELEAFEGVIAKQRSLLPSLALLIHLAQHPQGGPVPISALNKAIRWVEYLEGHARRIFATALDSETTAVLALVKRLQDGDLDRFFDYYKHAVPTEYPVFTARDVYKNHWKGLDRESTEKALAWLVKANWLWEQTAQTNGRPTTFYFVHPSVLK